MRWLRGQVYSVRRELRTWRALVKAHEGSCPRCTGSDEVPMAFCEEYWVLMRRISELAGWLDVVEELSATF